MTAAPGREMESSPAGGSGAEREPRGGCGSGPGVPRPSRPAVCVRPVTGHEAPAGGGRAAAVLRPWPRTLQSRAAPPGVTGTRLLYAKAELLQEGQVYF